MCMLQTYFKRLHFTKFFKGFILRRLYYNTLVVLMSQLINNYKYNLLDREVITVVQT